MGLLNLCQNAICHVPVKTSNNGRWKLPIHMALALLKRNLDKLHGGHLSAEQKNSLQNTTVSLTKPFVDQLTLQ